MPTIHTATATFTWRGTYYCAACGLMREATVQTEGTGKARAAYSSGNTSARGAAADSARRAGVAYAQRTLAVLPCPKCNARSSQAVTLWWARSLAVALFYGALALGVAALISINLPDTWSKWIRWTVNTLVGGGVLYLVLSDRIGKLRSAPSRVKFLT